MVIKNPQFIGSFPSFRAMPPTNLPEFAFAGRSNVGKSSLINMVCQKRKLAHTSSTPGKTQMINLFNIDDKWMLADLPGYGFAKVSKAVRGGFPTMIREYISERKNLACTFVLIDCRIPPQAIDIEFINMFGESERPFIIVFTKTDKISIKEMNERVSGWKSMLAETWEEFPAMIGTSAIKHKGRDNLMEAIRAMIQAGPLTP